MNPPMSLTNPKTNYKYLPAYLPTYPPYICAHLHPTSLLSSLLSYYEST